MQNCLLSCLTAPDLALLAPHLVQLPLIQGAVLHEPETAILTIYFPLSGVVSLFALTKKGEAVEIASVGREGAIGVFAHSGVWRARSRAVVQIPGIAIAIASPVLRTLMGRSDRIRELVIRYKGMLAAHSQQLAACNALHSVEERVARWLLQISERSGTTNIVATQDTISNALAVRRSSVTLAAIKFQQRGVIRYGRGRISIDNPAGLRALACDCYEAERQADVLLLHDEAAARASA
jgi:CRP-like cAMP-binding protein